MYVVAISSIILLTGYSGQVSLGHGALLAVGGYGAALVRNEFNAPVWLCFAAAVLLAALWGALLGATAARLSGPYLAGTTLALAVGLPSIANQFKFLGGEQGLIFDIGLPPASLGEFFSQYKWFFWIAALTALIAMWWLQNLLRSRYGRTWRAVRSQSVAAELAGINLARSKILAFTVSAGLAGLAGALLSMSISTVSPGAFPLSLSFALATGAVLSGVTTLGGVIIGAVTLVAIPEVADTLTQSIGASENVIANLPGLMVSGLLIVAVLFVPNGPVEQLKHRQKR
ncbi:MAG: branched-chain amino acid ABC transporter permease [Actinobacteria bacterium]|nr:branched-chain amino acid ABC transporter permease [Actinomycetota bacterium]MSW63038.1 branched-chain amino acid ABC transporter permease [Actinomycetota bacterium]MSX90086.1 branched-chain amino acid ABC transporter permease [Actinomycetota bacterium]MSZ64442.1 branched-chain amino acid ABC transporter permease [Actinomycetota bacterium]MTA58212.1 branched-chain amino acid ABC transporter permease [Actinomycetota bacterium]